MPAINWVKVKKWLVEKERLGGIKKGSSKELILTCLDECMKEAASLAKPKIISKTISAGSPGAKIPAKKLLPYIKKADKLFFFAVTIGKKLEDTASAYMLKGDNLRGYFLDRIGSMAVESLAESVEEALRQKFGSVSPRFSPGYCDWQIEGQKRLSKIVAFRRAGINLTKGLMMSPKKSISGVIFIGAKGAFSAKRNSPCSICNDILCNYRRTA